MAVVLADIDCRLQHEGREWNAFPPCPKTKGHEETKNQKNDSCTPVSSIQIPHSGAESKADIEDSRDPDELLGEKAREPDIGVGEDEGDGEAEGKKNNGSLAKRKSISIVEDTA